jgi:putative cell wall-binding protein
MKKRLLSLLLVIVLVLSLASAVYADSGLPNVTRLAGKDRIQTAFQVADQLKKELAVEKFDNMIVASGATFADALPGSYLSAVKNAPILLTLAKQKYIDQTADYIKANLKDGGTVYILGGESAVPPLMEKALAGLNVKRVAGKDRFGTNLEILKEAGVKPGDEILVCTAKEFADSLSAAATGKPILLVYKKITNEQKAYLATLSGNSFCVVGGTSAVPETISGELEKYGSVSRLAGKNRMDTSVLVAKTFFPDAQLAVVAYGWDFPDGLCGGSLAYAMGAPLLLTHSKTKLYSFTAAYTTKAGITDGFVLGGDGLVSDEATKAIFGNNDISILK